MKFEFVDYKTDLSYETLLAKITYRYCNNSDGRIYTTYKSSNANGKDIVEQLVSQLTPFFMNKKNAIILNLLVNPFFEELCNYMFTNLNINCGRKKLLKRYVFSYLCNDNTKKIYADIEVEGALIYIGKNMYEKSKVILERF